MTKVDHSSRAHAQLGASSCYRWWNCPGCFRMAALVAPVASTSIYALEGTAAHQLCDMCLQSGQDAIEFMDRRIPIGTHVFTVDEEMAAAVQVYLDVCREYIGAEGWEILIEKKFTLDALNPPGPMFGTADFVAINRKLGKVVVVDFKYGKGVVVEIQDNPQLKYYALGVACALPPDVKIRDIETIVVQSRVSTTPKSATYRAIDLFKWALELIEHAKATLDSNAPCIGGPWCRSTFCPASGQCLAEADAAFAAAQIEFTGKVLEGEIIEPNKLPQIARLTPQDLGRLKKNFEVLKGFMRSVDEALVQLVQDGAEDTGWKLVIEEGHRKWNEPDQKQLVLNLSKKLGLSPIESQVTTVISPAQAEAKTVTKLRAAKAKAGEPITKKAAEALVKEELKALTNRPPTKPKLVNDTHESPALPARGSEFPTKLPAFLEQ